MLSTDRRIRWTARTADGTTDARDEEASDTKSCVLGQRFGMGFAGLGRIFAPGYELSEKRCSACNRTRGLPCVPIAGGVQDSEVSITYSSLPPRGDAVEQNSPTRTRARLAMWGARVVLGKRAEELRPLEGSDYGQPDA